MKSNKSKEIILKLLDNAGIKINGINTWDIQVHDERLYKRVLKEGSLGLGEAYMDGWWDAKAPDEFISRIISSDLQSKIKNWRILPFILLNIVTNAGSKMRAFRVGEHHYDIGNNLYKKMLDKRMIYTCGYWKDAKNLDEAQENKLELICRKLNFKKGMTVLDVGCGWGGFAKYAVERYGVKVVGVTISKEQAKLAKSNCDGLPIDIRLEDYRDTVGSFDRIVSIGMFEHVGYKNYGTFMKKVHTLLKDDGLFLLHTIGGNISRVAGEMWADKYIFPGGMLPSIKQIGESMEGRFVMEDWHNFGADYDKTLMAWFENFDNGWEEIKNSSWIKKTPNVEGDVFYRMWKYYLLAFAGSFRARKNQLWQIVLSKKGVVGGYQRIT